MRWVDGIGSEELVRATYRGILRRDPSPTEIAHYLDHLGAGKDAAWLMDRFVNSPEFGASRSTDGAAFPLDDAPPNAIQLDYGSDDLLALWRQVASVWAGFGEADPYWSVLTNERYLSKNMTSAAILDEFYASAAVEKHRLEAWLLRNDVTFAADAVCAEYGCGVGRITTALSDLFARVIAFDISEPHLRTAGTYLHSKAIENVELVLVRDPEDLRHLEGVDLFYSVIVLQHNTPPIMIEILRRAFTGLRPGGVAFFQIPTYSTGYSFSIEGYWRSIAEKREMEMHVLPQREVFRLAHQLGMRPLEVQPDWCVGMSGSWLSHTFLMRKE